MRRAPKAALGKRAKRPRHTSRARGEGFVLVAVLGAVMTIGAVVFALLFSASLDVVAMRANVQSVLAREQLHGALAVTAAEVRHRYTNHSGELPPHPPAADEHGPWPELGIQASVTAQHLPTDDHAVVVRLTATSRTQQGRQPEILTLQLHPSLLTLRRGPR